MNGVNGVNGVGVIKVMRESLERHTHTHMRESLERGVYCLGWSAWNQSHEGMEGIVMDVVTAVHTLHCSALQYIPMDGMCCNGCSDCSA